uniref:IS30 family transposase n=1 Tax=Nakamurella panacisegetis TaxID=1090615 RepID=UPI0038B2730E
MASFKVYRRGEVVRIVKPLDRLAVKTISPRYRSQDERIEIAELRQTGLSIRRVAQRIGRAPSTVSRELRRLPAAAGHYRPFEAHRDAIGSRARTHGRRIDIHPELREEVGARLAQRWSPPQIARHLRVKFPDRASMRRCHESIYQALYQPGSALVRPAAVPSPRPSPLRTGRDHRKAHQRIDRRRPRFQQPMLSVHQRPFPPHDRSEAGHWEGELIVGSQQGSVIGTLIERQTRLIRLLHLPSRDADALRRAISDRMADLPASLLRSITWGHQGIEMARHVSITAELGAQIYFCDPHSPWQRGSNENANGLLRQHSPKGTNLAIWSREHLQAVEDEINGRPRLVFDNRRPADLFAT